MQENYTQALMILTVGMTTVFVILTLVVLMSRWMILMVNHFSSKNNSASDKIPPTHIAAIHGVVDHVLDGGGHIVNIHKVR